MKLAITGPPGTGKTTLLRWIVNRVGDFVGFYTEEVREGGRRIGFRVVRIEIDESFWLASIDRNMLKDPTYRVGRYFVDKAALNRIIEILEEAYDHDRIAIDEVGKMELIHPRFWDIILDLLRSDKTVLLTYGKNIDRAYRKVIENTSNVIELKKRGDAERRLPIVLARFREETP